MSPLSRRARVLLYGAVVALALASSAASLGNAFALDDVALVATNQRVHSLSRWWSFFAQPYWPAQFGPTLYRPLTVLVFAVQWAVGGGASWVFHLTSLVLYAGVSALVLALFLRLLPVEGAFVGAALFAVHPVHVEAVGNVVGQNELIAAAAMLGAVLVYVRARARGSLGPRAIASIAGLFAAACFTKEHGLLLPALLIAVEGLVFSRGAAGSTAVETGVVRAASPHGGWRGRVREHAPLYLTLGAVGVAYLTARASVLGGMLGEQDVVPMRGLTRLWTMLVVVPHWLRLLLWPAALSADYSPQQIAIPHGADITIIPGAAILIGAVLLFIATGRAGRTVPGGARFAPSESVVARLGLAWTGVMLLPVSNLFSAMILGERTLFLPSAGALLAVGAGASAVLHAVRRHPRAGLGVPAGMVALGAMLTLGVVRSAARQRVWRDDTTLLTQTVKDAPLSYRAQFFYGQLLFEQGNPGEGERRLRVAIRLNPTPSDVSPLNYLATQYRDAGMCPQAIPLYERAMANAPGRPDVRYGLAACLASTGRVAEARRLAEDGVRRGDFRSLFTQLVAHIDTLEAR